MQEHDLKGALGQGQEKDIAVYVGLAAAAFLLVMLHPSKEEEKPKGSRGIHPITQEGLQVCT